LGAGTWSLALLGISALGSNQVAAAYILAILSGFGVATAYVIPWSMLPDVIEYDQLRTGRRREGSYYALAAFFQKLGTGLALWLMAQILAATDYVTPALGADVLPQQPGAAINALRLFTGPVCAALLLVAILFAWRYPIGRREHAANLRVLEQPSVQ
jgi:GPH family glycoside/pentoside/hexuronide:cation symporter